MKGIRARAIIFLVIAVILVIGITSVAYAATDTSKNQVNCTWNHQLDLKLKDQNEYWNDGVTGTWKADKMVPGMIYPLEGQFTGLKVNSPAALDITCRYKVIEESPIVEPDANRQSNLVPDNMAKSLTLTKCLYRGCLWQIDCLTGEWQIKIGNCYLVGCYTSAWQLRDTDRDGRKTFYDLKQSPLVNLPLPDSSIENTKFEISVKFDDRSGNQFQGDTLKFDMIYSARDWDLQGTCGLSSRDCDRYFFGR
jgi:hypothetical protein